MMIKTLIAIAVFAAWSPPLIEPEQRAIEYECTEKGCTLSKADFAWLVNRHREAQKHIRQCYELREA